LISLIVLNLPRYAMEVWVQRAPDFYRHYEGGVNRSFIAAAKFVREHADPNSEIGITHRTKKNGHDLLTYGPMRAFSFLTDRPTMIPSKEISDDDPAQNPALLQWAIANNIRYYISQPPTQVWYHFRGVPWKPMRFDQGDFDWRIYELRGGE